MTTPPPFVFLDDDPTGTQEVADVPVLLRWEAGALEYSLLRSGAAAVHLLTNSRAFPAPAAEAIVYEAARAVRAVAPEAPLLVRGDSTLRGHLLEEYRAVWRATGEALPPPLLLVPALPAAGRVTRGGVHLLVREGEAVELSRTEYAKDGAFAYHSARLVEWADERSDGLLAATRGVEVPLAVLRERGPDAITEALARAGAGREPAVCAPDAETVADLEIIAGGFRNALSAGMSIAARCAPTFAGVLAGTLARARVAVPPVRDGVLIVCGSYVSNTTRQLDYLREHRGIVATELDPSILAGDEAGAEKAVRHAGDTARRDILRQRVALVATKRVRPSGTRNFEAGMRIARRLAHIASYVGDAADVVIAKGGITSAVTLQEGIGAVEALAVGPVMPGVALWRPRVDRQISYLVVPGNVGGPSLLADLLGVIGV